MRNICIYHSPCLDGYTAAWAVWRAHPDWEFIPGVHGDPPPDVTGADVYLVDFSYKRPVLIEMAKTANRIIILDHHKTAQEDLKDFAEATKNSGVVDWMQHRIEVIFDMEHSGAYLAWKYFHPDSYVPMFVRLVEDRDLWKFEIPNSRDANASFFSHEYDFQTWNTLFMQCEYPDTFAELVAGGKAIERKHFKDIHELLAKLEHHLTIGGVSVSVANLPYTMASDGAHAMSLQNPFAATYYFDGEYYVFSLRSDENGVDVSEIAKTYQGGGHKHAAGFRVKSLEEL